MGTKPLRYTVDIDGIARKILSVSHQKTGLIFDLKPALWRRPVSGDPYVSGKIEYSRVTFHHSLDSPSGNLITKTTSSSDPESRHVQFTHALKVSDTFAPIHARRFPDLSKGWPESRRGVNDISLGQFDPSRFTLVMCVFVGNANRPFSLTDPWLDHGIRTDERTIGAYKVLVLYSFYPQPSIEHGSTAFLWTSKGEATSVEAAKETEYIMAGFDDHHVREHFFRCELQFGLELFQLSGSGLGPRSEKGTITSEK